MDNTKIYTFRKNLIRTNTKNSVEVRHFTNSLMYFCLFIFKVTADQLFKYKVYLYQNVYIYICIIFALNSKGPTMSYEDVKVVCKVMCSLVKQNVVF